MKKIILLFLILLCSKPNSLSQSKHGITLTIKLIISTGSLDNANLTVENNKTRDIQTYKGINSPKRKTYNFTLSFNEEFTLTFSKPGFITKCILFDTNLPKEKQNEDFKPTNFAVELFESNDSIPSTEGCKPLSKWKYSEKHNDFDIEIF